MSIQDIYEVFVDYYGEERVYLETETANELSVLSNPECSAILVHWPVVEVTNENNEKITIWDLYSRTLINNSTLYITDKPRFNRATYNQAQWDTCYMHSHVPSINKANLQPFTRGCLGTSPLVNTNKILSYSTDLDVWRLYCWELDKYVHVESLIGGPYIKLRTVAVKDRDATYSRFNINTTKYLSEELPVEEEPSCYDFVKELLKTIIKENVLTFVYYNSSYRLGGSFTSTVIKISNIFIKLLNNAKKTNSLDPSVINSLEYLIIKGVLANGSLILETNELGHSLEEAVGKELFKFKDRIVTLQKKEVVPVNDNKIRILDIEVINSIVTFILNYVNIFYGRTITADKVGYCI